MFTYIVLSNARHQTESLYVETLSFVLINSFFYNFPRSQITRNPSQTAKKWHKLFKEERHTSCHHDHYNFHYIYSFFPKFLFSPHTYFKPFLIQTTTFSFFSLFIRFLRYASLSFFLNLRYVLAVGGLLMFLWSKCAGFFYYFILR